MVLTYSELKLFLEKYGLETNNMAVLKKFSIDVKNMAENKKV